MDYTRSGRSGRWQLGSEASRSLHGRKKKKWKKKKKKEQIPLSPISIGRFDHYNARR